MGVYHREINEPINCLVNTEGLFNFGTYNTAIPKINMLDAKNPLGFCNCNWFKSFRLKEWEAFQLGDDEVFIFGVVYNAKIAAFILLIIYDKTNDQTYKYQKIVNPSKAIVASGMLDTYTNCSTSGYGLFFHNNLEEDEIDIFAKFTSSDKLPEAVIDITAYHITQPIVVCHPLGENRAMYSHKNFMPVEGYMFLKDREIAFDSDKAYMMIDDHKGYYPWNLKYDWVMGWGYDNKGQLFGFNLTHNQVIDPEKYNENCIWLDGTMNVLPPINVYMGKKVWIIKDEYGMVDLRFYPVTEASIKFNLLLICSDYEAPIGRFEGFFDLDGRCIQIGECFGMGEKTRYRI